MVHLGIELLGITPPGVKVPGVISMDFALQGVIWVRVVGDHFMLGIISLGVILLGVIPEGVILLGVILLDVVGLGVMSIFSKRLANSLLVAFGLSSHSLSSVVGATPLSSGVLNSKVMQTGPSWGMGPTGR